MLPRLLGGALVLCVLGCGAGRIPPGEPAPEGAAVIVEFGPDRDLLIRVPPGDTIQIVAAQRVLGRIRHHDPDSLVLVVSSVLSAAGEVHFSNAHLHLAEPGTARVTVLSLYPPVMNWFIILLIPALFLSLLLSAPAT